MVLAAGGCGVFSAPGIDRKHGVRVGWLNVINAQDYGQYDHAAKDAKGFECGINNIPACLALEASLKLIEEIAWN